MPINTVNTAVDLTTTGSKLLSNGASTSGENDRISDRDLDGSDNLVSQPPKKRRKRELDIALADQQPYKRGSNGWEECLRPRPSQVDHYQTLLYQDLYKKAVEKKERKKMASQSQSESSDSQDGREDKNDFPPLLDDPILGNIETQKPDIEIKEPKRKKKAGLRPDNAKRVPRLKKDSEMKRERPVRTLIKNDEYLKQLFPKTFQIPKKDSSSTKKIHSADEKEIKIGEVIWGRLGNLRWWPAITIPGSHCGQRKAKSMHYWVFWFGDYKISELPRKKLQLFVHNFNARYTDTSGQQTALYQRAVNEAIKECAVRADLDISENNLLPWAKRGFKVAGKNYDIFSPESGTSFSDAISKRLERIKAINTRRESAEKITLNEMIINSVSEETLKGMGEYVSNGEVYGEVGRAIRSQSLHSDDSAIKKVRQGSVDIEDICLACDSSTVEIVCQHPMFEGGLCQQCKDEISETMYAYGEDGTNAYCTICAHAGELVICDDNDCNRVFCTDCIELLVSTDARKAVLQSSNTWLCYLCTEYSSESHGLIRKKLQWQANLATLFKPKIDYSITPNYDDFKVKRPLRVLSLFDGIATGKLALDSIGVDVDAYYACEADKDATSVSRVRHGYTITHVGSTHGLDSTQIQSLCPIDLVVAGPPCADLTVTNQKRKGLHDPCGTGALFYDFYRVLCQVKLANRGKHVFWLFENTAAMPTEYKKEIDRFLECEPAVIDSKFFSAHTRARYFWGNIPGMYSSIQPHIVEKNPTLDSILTPHCDRKALKKKMVSVIASDVTSGSPKAKATVLMNGEEDHLWISEMEEMFGFPRHYTDVANLPLSRRQELINSAWTVPVVKHILMPLRSFFKVTGPPTNTHDKL